MPPGCGGRLATPRMARARPPGPWGRRPHPPSTSSTPATTRRRCTQLAGGTLGSQQPVRPNDHVNMGQSSNDTFPTAMHIAAYTMATQKTIPALRRLRDACERKSGKWAEVVKTGRTHLEDAVPLTVGQEWSGYAGALYDAIAEVEHATRGLLTVAMGGTAVGDRLNAPPGFAEQGAAGG